MESHSIVVDSVLPSIELDESEPHTSRSNARHKMEGEQVRNALANFFMSGEH